MYMELRLNKAGPWDPLAGVYIRADTIFFLKYYHQNIHSNKHTLRVWDLLPDLLYWAAGRNEQREQCWRSHHTEWACSFHDVISRAWRKTWRRHSQTLSHAGLSPVKSSFLFPANLFFSILFMRGQNNGIQTFLCLTLIYRLILN